MATGDQQNQTRREEPIIIKKKKGHGGHGHHGGAWKVAYADFVTAMMAFFIVMWILASSEETKKLVSAYFEDPGAFSFITGKRAVPVDLNLKPSGKGDGEDEKGKSNFVISFNENDTANASVKMVVEYAKDSAKAAERVSAVGESLKKYLEEQIIQRPELKDILSSIKIEMTKEGLRIELIESQESLFFEIGSAKVSKKAQDVLYHLAQEIGKLPNFVEIEGHTDSRKYSGHAIYSNWELSADRANSARRILESKGLWDGQIIKVTGFSDRKLRTPDNPFDITNRRISILIRQLSASDFVQDNQSIVKEN